MMWIWSGDTLMDLQPNEALKMISKTIDASDYLFVEAGGFAFKIAPGWKSEWFVMKRTGK